MANSIWLNAGVTSPIFWPDGTAALPGAAFVSEPSSGLYRVSAGDISLQVLGVSRIEASTAASTLRAPDGGAYFNVQNGIAQVNSAALHMANASTAKWIFSAVSATDGQLVMTAGNTSLGVGLDVTTDAVLKIRTRAQSAYATVDALGYKVGGVAGVAAFGPSVVTSITVVNGLITAIS